MIFEFTNINFTHQRRDILVVFIAGFGFRNGNLFQNRRPDFNHFKFGNIATKVMQAFCCPRRHDGAEIAWRNAILFIQNIGVLLRIEQA